MQPTRFNVFQRIMRLWDEVHPYNAAQVLHLRGNEDVNRAAIAWKQTLAALGLGRVCVEADRFRHEPGDGAEPVRRVGPDVKLDDFISAEMNRPFVTDGAAGYSPFRPFLLQRDGEYYLGVIYQHWVADSVSIRMLLREWFLRLHDPRRAGHTPVRVPRGGYWHFFGPGRGRWGLGDGVLSTLRFATRFGHVRRIEGDDEDFSVHCYTYALPEGLMSEVHTAARRDGLTLNDVFLAAAAEACDDYGIPPRTADRRELALGSIVDLRPCCDHELDNVFGLFLGFTTVMVRPPALDHWPRLLKTIAQQTAWQKRCHLAAASVVRMAAAVAEAEFLAPRDWVKFYMQHMPLAAGISNVNMARSWAADYHPSILLDYLRYSPTGPTLPVVFSPTSLGNKSALALTCRMALIDASCARRLAGAFIRRLEVVAAPSSVELEMAGV